MLTIKASFSCKDCTERKQGCHSSCNIYKREREELDQARAELNKSHDAGAYVTDRVNRAMDLRAMRKRKMDGYKKYGG